MAVNRRWLLAACRRQVLGTDGVSDNLSDAEICEALLAPLVAGKSAAELAQVLAALAHAASLDPRRSSPFAQAASKQGLAFPGGKPDDVTVLCVRVLTDEDPAGRAADEARGEGSGGDGSEGSQAAAAAAAAAAGQRLASKL